MNEAIREMFLSEWVETASKNEIVEKLIEHDERAKQIKQLKEELEDVNLRLEIAQGHRKEVQDEELRQRKAKEKLQSTLEEIRNHAKNHTFSLESIISYYDDLIYGEDILQIIDKERESDVK